MSQSHQNSKPLKRRQKTAAPTPSQGQISFRLLCSTRSAGGVIGHSGFVVKRLESETSAIIHLDGPLSKDRLVHVIGSAIVDRTLRFQPESVTVEVSTAQAGLVRVFERVLEVEPPPEGAMVRCRLLVTPGLVGAVIGEGGKRINKIGKDSGAFVKIFSAESLPPPYGGSSDEVIQLTGGGSLAVKKALVVVSQYLQRKFLQIATTNGETCAGDLHPTMAKEMNDAIIKNTGNGGVAIEVVFKLLCRDDAAGAVIGWKGRKVKALEDETGASICFSAHEAGCVERVITVSAFENRDSVDSSAQNALLRVFNESTSSDGRRAVTARLLIQPNQAGWLNRGSSNISSIQKATGAKLRILEDNYAPSGASTYDRILQVDGDYSSVLIALFQVSWRLRDNMVGKDNAPLLPHILFNLHPFFDQTGSLADNMGKLKFQPAQFPNGHQLPSNMENATNLTTDNGDFDLGSGNKSIVVTNTKLEIVVRKNLFGSVYGDDGRNLARLRMISGAIVEVHDPSAGNDGKVIISGTPDQTRSAQSLLQAFMMSPK